MSRLRSGTVYLGHSEMSTLCGTRVRARARLLAAALVLFAALTLASCGGGVGNGAADSRLASESSGPVKRTFGMHIHNALEYWPTEPFSSWRLWDATVDWSRVEPSRGFFDFSRLDQYVKLAQAHHVQIIYVFGNTPAWAAQDPYARSNEGIPGASSPPENYQDFEDFVSAVVTRYKGRIQAYEIWNEANLEGYWTGTPAEMLQLTQGAYAVIKHVDPAATVLAPSVVAQSGIKWLSAFLASGGASYTDAIAYHVYSTDPAPEKLTQYYREVMAVGQQWGKSVWDTEVGWGPWGTFTDAESASFLARTFILQAAAGFTHIGWYAWDDRGAWVHLYLVEPDLRTPTLAGIAFGQVQTWLQDSGITCSSDATDTWQCEVTSADGTHRFIIWKLNGFGTFSVPAEWQVARVRDLQGDVRPLDAGQIQVGLLPVLLER